MTLQLIAAGIKRRHKRAPEPLSEIKKKAIIDALHTFGGHKTKAAKRLGITRQGLYLMLKRLEDVK